MFGIELITLAEAKEICNKVLIDNDNVNIEENVYGVLINNEFIPVKLEGMDEYLHA